MIRPLPLVLIAACSAAMPTALQAVDVPVISLCRVVATFAEEGQSGAGAWISHDTVVTARHVVFREGRLARNIAIRDADDVPIAGATAVAWLTGGDRFANDVALIRVNGHRSGHPLSVAAVRSLTCIGTALVPSGGTWTTLQQVRTPLDFNPMGVLISPFAAQKGQSGSPVTDGDGNLIGVLVAARVYPIGSIIAPVDRARIAEMDRQLGTQLTIAARVNVTSPPSSAQTR